MINWREHGLTGALALLVLALVAAQVGLHGCLNGMRLAVPLLAASEGRSAAAIGVLMAGILFAALGGDYPRAGAICALIYALGIPAAWLIGAPAAPPYGRSNSSA